MKLPYRVRDWPPDARKAFARLKDDLYRWCKKHNHPPKLNGLIAAIAVRQVWER